MSTETLVITISKLVPPCIDTGDDSVVQPGWVDMDGQPRIIGSHVDIGADEFVPEIYASSNPNPPNGATDVSPSTALSWTPGYGATSHDLYLWEDGSTKPIEPNAAGLASCSYQPAAPLKSGTKYCWQVVAKGSAVGNVSGPVWTFTTRSAPPSGPISQAKALADGTSVNVEGVIVTAVFEGCFYVEQTDRASGIRVAWNQQVAVNSCVTITGTMRTTTDFERYIEATSVEAETCNGNIAPLIMTTRSIGGSDLNYNAVTGAGQKGTKAYHLVKVDDSWVRSFESIPGLNNIGLLVRTFGRVTYQGSDGQGSYFYVDDGSGMDDGNENVPGVRVQGTVSCENPVGKFVQVTGISSCYKVDGEICRLIRPTEIVVCEQ